MATPAPKVETKATAATATATPTAAPAAAATAAPAKTEAKAAAAGPEETKETKVGEVVLLPKPEGKANVLILGGTGFIGRNLVQYLVANNLASTIRVADKAMPGTSYLSDEHKAAFAQRNIVQFQQSDLSKADHVTRAFKEVKFNYVINLCGETRFGLSEGDYKVKCAETATKCAQEAKRLGVEKWVEVSTAQIYETGGKKACAEDAKVKPWTMQATYRLRAEEIIKAEGPPSVIIRPATVYGSGDLTGLSPRLCCAAVYKKMNEKMKFLWDEKLRLNCVHVRDVVAALWIAATTITPGQVYNLADAGDLNQGKLNTFLGNLFAIKTGFVGTALSTMASVNMTGTAAATNDKHVPTWTKLCQEHKILNTPLSPYIDKELLASHSLWVDGTKITRDYPAFTYTATVSEELVREQLAGFIRQGLFPPVLE